MSSPWSILYRLLLHCNFVQLLLISMGNKWSSSSNAHMAKKSPTKKTVRSSSASSTRRASGSAPTKVIHSEPSSTCEYSQSILTEHLKSLETETNIQKISIQLSFDFEQTTVAGISQDEIVLLRRFWRQLRTTVPEEPGKSIYTEVLSQSKDLRDLFFPDGESLRQNSDQYQKKLARLRKQLNTALDYVVAHLDKPQDLEYFLVNLGRIHLSKINSVLFMPKHWDIFADAMIIRTFRIPINRYNVRNLKEGSLRVTWITVIYYVIGKLKHGFYNERRVQMSKRARSSNALLPSERSNSGVPMANAGSTPNIGRSPDISQSDRTNSYFRRPVIYADNNSDSSTAGTSLSSTMVSPRFRHRAITASPASIRKQCSSPNCRRKSTLART